MRTAFTLVELLVVIAVLAIVAALSVSYFISSNDAAKRKNAKVQLAAISSGIENFHSDHGDFPVNNGGAADGAAIIYQALSGDGNDKLGFSGDADSSQGRLGSSGEVYLHDLADPNGGSVKLRGSANGMYVMVDPWMEPYRYMRRGTAAERRTGQKNEAAFDLWSLGGGSDDEEGEPKWIKNW
ncbi:MAG: prepilin-type N-terminal cleavage/methylation domain-containing protein [Verrucomicrobiota bacterium]